MWMVSPSTYFNWMILVSRYLVYLVLGLDVHDFWLMESFIPYVTEASASRKYHSFPGTFTVSLAWRRRAELFGDGNMCGFCGQDVKSNVFEGCFSPGPSFGQRQYIKVGFLSDVIGVVDSSTNSVPGLWDGHVYECLVILKLLKLAEGIQG